MAKISIFRLNDVQIAYTYELSHILNVTRYIRVLEYKINKNYLKMCFVNKWKCWPFTPPIFTVFCKGQVNGETTIFSQFLRYYLQILQMSYKYYSTDEVLQLVQYAHALQSYGPLNLSKIRKNGVLSIFNNNMWRIIHILQFGIYKCLYLSILRLWTI